LNPCPSLQDANHFDYPSRPPNDDGTGGREGQATYSPPLRGSARLSLVQQRRSRNVGHSLPLGIDRGRKFVHVPGKHRDLPDLLVFQCGSEARHSGEADSVLHRPERCGLTTFQNAENFDPAAFESKRAQLEATIKQTPGLLSSRVLPSEGMWVGGSELSFDAEFTVPKGASVSHVEKLVKQIAKEHNQESAFITRVHDENRPNSGPIAEFGFKNPINQAQAEQIVKEFGDYGIEGLTIAKNLKGDIVGLRTQSIPEFSGQSHSEWLNNFEKFRASLDHSNLTYATRHNAETKIFRRGQDY
jgi:hypothetical protein